MNRTILLTAGILLITAWTLSTGCMGPVLRPQSPETGLFEHDSQSNHPHWGRGPSLWHGLHEGRVGCPGYRPGWDG